MAARSNTVLSPTSFERVHPWVERKKKKPDEANLPKGFQKLSPGLIKNILGFVDIVDFARDHRVSRRFAAVTLVDWQHQQNYIDTRVLSCVIRYFSKNPELLAHWRSRVKVLEWEVGRVDDVEMTRDEFHQLFPLSGEPLFPAIQTQRLNLWGLTEGDFPRLVSMMRNCPNVTRCVLEDGNADQLLLLLQKSPLLTQLDLKRCTISMAKLASTLKAFTKLQVVNLAEMPCKSDVDVEALLSTQKIAKVEMHDAVTDLSLRRIAQSPWVKEASLTYCGKVTEKGVEALCRSTTLESLHLYSCGGLQAIAALNKTSGLRALRVSMDDLETRPVSLASLKECPQLTDLFFEDFRDLVDTRRLMPTVFHEIGQCTGLRTLQVRTSLVDTKGILSQLSNLRQLRSLTISSVREFLEEENEDEIAALVKGLPYLQELDFNDCFGIQRERLRQKLHKAHPAVQIASSQN